MVKFVVYFNDGYWYVGDVDTKVTVRYGAYSSVDAYGTFRKCVVLERFGKTEVWGIAKKGID